MTTLNYIRLVTSNGTTLDKKFKVIMGSLKHVRTKTKNQQRSITGRLDVQEGVVIEAWTMTLRVSRRATGLDPEGSSWGVFDDLVTLYGYNDPSGTPSNVVKFYDHLNNAHDVVMSGELAPDMLTPFLDGGAAYALVQVFLESVN